MNQSSGELARLIDIIKSLRGEGGCPWDKKQTAKSLARHIEEETGELLEGISREDEKNICEELGDLLFLIIMVAEIYDESGKFNLADVMTSASDKLVRRHPHVFADAVCRNEEELKAQWEAIKRAEKEGRI